MPMNASTLAAACVSKAVQKGAGKIVPDDQLNALAEAFAEAVIEHIISNATIAGVVTTCPAGAGTATGAPGSIT